MYLVRIVRVGGQHWRTRTRTTIETDQELLNSSILWREKWSVLIFLLFYVISLINVEQEKVGPGTRDIVLSLSKPWDSRHSSFSKRRAFPVGSNVKFTKERILNFE
jgi:hypothetical protein